jgi:hypothetical protein
MRKRRSDLDAFWKVGRVVAMTKTLEENTRKGHEIG